MEDGPPDETWMDEPWRAARNEAQLFARDAEAERRRARLVDAVLAEAARKDEGRRAAARLWEAVCALLRG